jgi:hypothetical protein
MREVFRASSALLAACLLAGVSAAIVNESGETRICPAKCLSNGACISTITNRVCVDSDQDGNCDFTASGNCPEG